MLVKGVNGEIHIDGYDADGGEFQGPDDVDFINLAFGTVSVGVITAVVIEQQTQYHR